jgi:hypothetical protein
MEHGSVLPGGGDAEDGRGGGQDPGGKSAGKGDMRRAVMRDDDGA